MKWCILAILVPAAALADHQYFIFGPSEDPVLVHEKVERTSFVFAAPMATNVYVEAAGAWADLDAEQKLAARAVAASRLAAWSADRLARAQAAKSTDHRLAENQYFLLCRTVLQTVSDPRATNSVPPKLGIAELATLLEPLESADFATAARLSLRLLAVDASLKRFSETWWDTATFHPELVP